MTTDERVRVIALREYLRRPRPRLAETSTTLRDVLFIALVGPCFLFAAINDLIDGGVWPAALILPFSAAVTLWGAAWMLRPTRVSRTSRRGS